MTTLVRPPEPDLAHLCVPPIVPSQQTIELRALRMDRVTVINGPVVEWGEAFADDASGEAGVTYISTYNGHDPDRAHATDIFATRTQGDAVAQFAIDNMDRYGIWYVIWRQRIYNPGVATYWRDMADRGSPTANHYDHVHVSFLDQPPNIEDDPEEEEMTQEERETLQWAHDMIKRLTAGFSDDDYEAAERLNAAVKAKSEGTVTIGGTYTITGKVDLKK